MRKILFMLITCVCLTSSLLAQKTITGKVTDPAGKPLSDVSIKSTKTQAGTSTAADGSFKLTVADDDVLQISMIGYAMQTVKTANLSSISIKLEATDTELSQIVLVGTRGAGRAKTETPVPVDVIRINQIGQPTAKMDLTSVLNIAAPSFNYNKQSGADGADHIDLGTLRGLGPDHTLVLINGKRRHSTAFVGLFGTRGRANSGVDMNGFPQASVDRIEILRDGASAQYGSDAIAGVINIILNKNINQWSVNAGWSGYYDHQFNSRYFNQNNDYYTRPPIDGGTLSLSVNNGFAVGKKGGFINISMNVLSQSKTHRAVGTDNWETKKYALPFANSGRRAFGDASVATFGGMYNMELPTGKKGKTSFYSFGGYNYKAADAFAYTRNFSARPERFPVTSNGRIIFVPKIMRVTKDGETYYNPRIQTHITDVSIASGLKGTLGKDWGWDISNNLGYNNFHYFGFKTFNASQIGKFIPNSFDDGGFNFLQNTINADISKYMPTVAAGLTLGFGAEFRYERYKIFSGEDLSYRNYSPTEIFYPNINESRSPASGSQGFPGFSNTDAVKAERNNLSVYADASLDVTKAFLLNGAVRFENYSDFGTVLTGKLATRIKATDNFNIRGSVSTGFRAPSLAQINFSNTLTSFSNGQLVQSLIAPNTNAITKAAGIPDLKEETSINGSLGFSWKPLRSFTITVDGYIVKMKDRVVLSGLFSKDDPTLSPAFTAQFPAEVSTAQFFANAVNTTNVGIDIVADYTKKWKKNTLRILLAGNLQQLEIDKVNIPTALNDTKLHQKTFYSDREEAFLKASAPKSKFSLGLDYTHDKLGAGIHFTSFGKIALTGFGDGAAPSGDNPNYSGINPQVPTDADPSVYVPEIFNYNHKVTTDIYGSYKFSKKVSLFIGADNLFNVHPDLGVNPLAKGWAGDNESGGPWDSVQMGFNGLRLFTKLAFTF